MTPERFEKLKQVLSRRQLSLTVLLEEVNKPHNFSAILRSCDAVGVLEAHAVAPRGGLPTYNATSGSAEKWVRVRQHERPLSAIQDLQSRGFQVLATHLSARALDYRDLDYTRPSCVLLGAEKWGVSREAAEASDHNIVIPMLGMVQSLNVSVACATILFEAQRQRLRAGMYAGGSLPRDQFDALLFEWAYPDLAHLHRERGEPYPALAEDGQVVTGGKSTERDTRPSSGRVD